MIIGLVKDSFLRCFCHSCSVNSAIPVGRHLHKKPLLKKTNKKPRSKQPKKSKYHATEIRCEEKSRGGMCYEVILAEPVAEKPESAKATSPRPKSTTAEDIQLKLQQAEDRRKTISAYRMSFIVDQLSKLEDASRKREEKTTAFIASTQLALEGKLDTSSSNREAYLNGLKAKITDHLNNVDGVRRQLDAQTEELRCAIHIKMKSAEENRDECLRKMLEKLKEHEEYAQRVRLGHEEAIRQLEERIQSKLEIAEAKRETEMLKKIENLREHDRRAELVRANKERLMANEKNETNASG
ncbi:stathmin [Oratosquilla oratoria]|uniref:stathmin n=1 Tax=Oratosquilla oratoria TaxID=337810 RepID=UPI003F75C2CC